MRSGDLVRFKARDEALELGGHRYLDSKRHWWVMPSYQTIDPDKVYIVIENNPRLYGAEADMLARERNVSVLMDSFSKTFLVAFRRQIKTVNRVQSIKP